MKIAKIIVVLQDGSKHFTAYTDLPSPVEGNDVLTMNMFIPGDWKASLDEYFNDVEVEVVDVRTNIKSDHSFNWR